MIYNPVTQSDDITNNSGVTGTTVSDALDTLESSISGEDTWDRTGTTVYPSTDGDFVAIGPGITTADVPLHVFNSDTSVVFDPGALIAIEDNVTPPFIHIATAINSYGGIFIGDSVNPYYTGISGEVGNQRLALSSGNLIINLGETIIEFNADGIDVDYQFKGDTDDNMLYLNSGTDSVGVKTATPNSSFHVLGSQAGTVTSTAVGITLDATHYIVKHTAGTVTDNLPTAVGIEGRIYTIKNSAGSGNITVDANGTETIDGSLTITIAPSESRTLVSDNANWIII